eukprot:394662-Lingulodinium_polyedra.AAC.1
MQRLPAPERACGAASQWRAYCTRRASAMIRAPHILAADTAAVCGRPYQASGLWSLPKRSRVRLAPAARSASTSPCTALP